MTNVPPSPQRFECSARWPLPLVGLHWVAVGVLLIGVAAVLLRESVEAKAPRLALLELHRHAGALLWATVCLRIILRWRLREARPDHGGTPLWRWSAATVHVALYGLLLAVPILGWLLGNARGDDARLVGLSLPRLVSEDDGLAYALETAHGAAAWALIALASAHALAALGHHLLLRDGVLRSMSVWRQ